MKVKVIAGIVCALCTGAFAQISDKSASDSSSKKVLTKADKL